LGCKVKDIAAQLTIQIMTSSFKIQQKLAQKSKLKLIELIIFEALIALNIKSRLVFKVAIPNKF